MKTFKKKDYLMGPLLPKISCVLGFLNQKIIKDHSSAGFLADMNGREWGVCVQACACVCVCTCVCGCVWWVLEKMREHTETTSIPAQQKWEDGITDVPEAKKGKM